MKVTMLCCTSSVCSFPECVCWSSFRLAVWVSFGVCSYCLWSKLLFPAVEVFWSANLSEVLSTATDINARNGKRWRNPTSSVCLFLFIAVVWDISTGKKNQVTGQFFPRNQGVFWGLFLARAQCTWHLKACDCVVLWIMMLVLNFLELSKYAWNLKERKEVYAVNWSIYRYIIQCLMVTSVRETWSCKERTPDLSSLFMRRFCFGIEHFFNNSLNCFVTYSIHNWATYFLPNKLQ